MRNAVAIADAGRDGEVRYIGDIDASPDSMKRFIGKLAFRWYQGYRLSSWREGFSVWMTL
jgi:transposase